MKNFWLPYRLLLTPFSPDIRKAGTLCACLSQILQFHYVNCAIITLVYNISTSLLYGEAMFLRRGRKNARRSKVTVSRRKKKQTEDCHFVTEEKKQTEEQCSCAAEEKMHGRATFLCREEKNKRRSNAIMSRRKQDTVTVFPPWQWHRSSVHFLRDCFLFVFFLCDTVALFLYARFFPPWQSDISPLFVFFLCDTMALLLYFFFVKIKLFWNGRLCVFTASWSSLNEYTHTFSFVNKILSIWKYISYVSNTNIWHSSTFVRTIEIFILQVLSFSGFELHAVSIKLSPSSHQREKLFDSSVKSHV